jgi:hypothetical protein
MLNTSSDPLEGFYPAPLCGAGIHYTSIRYIRSDPGIGESAERIRAFAPSLSAGIEAGYHIIKDRVSAFAGAEYMGIFEREMTATSCLFYAGVEYTLGTAGR